MLKITEKAMLIEINEEDVWLPLSQVADYERYEEGDTDLTLSITEFIAEKEGLEGD